MYHPFAASGGADGVVKVGNVSMLMEKTRKNTTIKEQTVYRLDINRTTGALRFVDNIVAQSSNKAVSSDVSSRYGLTIGWHPAIAITSVRWNPNHHRECWLASATAAGAVRIDYVGGRPGPEL